MVEKFFKYIFVEKYLKKNSILYYIMDTQNSFNKKIKCNKFYTKRYMPEHQQTLQHIENTYEFNVEEDIEQRIEDYFV